MRNLDEIKKISDTFEVSRSTDGMNEHLIGGGVPFLKTLLQSYTIRNQI